MNFIHEDFLLHSEPARRLYHGYAEHEPILDYHSHLPPADLAGDRRFQNLFELWLEGDHYKWRAMRANGISERYCTGSASPFEKFQAWAETVPYTLRNPLYHWTHLELKRYFDIDDLLSGSNARSIWDRVSSRLADGDFSAQRILRKFDVRVLCTTDDPCSDLKYHRQLAGSPLPIRIFPAFRPDRALAIQDAPTFNSWVGELERASNTHIASLRNFLDALKRRHGFFHDNGARLSDHGLNHCYASPCTEQNAAAIFDKVRKGNSASEVEHEQFASYLMLFFGQLDAARGWTKQLHLGALRSVNTRAAREIGADSGFDSTGDWPQASSFCRYLDALDRENALPKLIVYNLNPADNDVFATAIGNFQDGSIAGKIQFGSGWWFLDQKEGIEAQLSSLSNSGLLSRFIGMVTDSRSFMSFPRHEYFRRVLCNLIGRDVENGELPDDEQLVGGMVRNICYENARRYLALDTENAGSQAFPPSASVANEPARQL